MATNPQQIVDQLLTLSADPENQAYIVRESGLVGYLSYPDNNVVFTAAKAIWHLSSGSSNRNAVKDHPGLFAKLRELKASPDSRVSEIVAKTIDNLSPAVKPLIISSAPTSENTFPAGAAPVSKAKPARARPIKMKVEGISQEYWRGMVEKALIRVPGVVSVTLDKRREEAIVYSKQRDGMLDSLVRAVSNLGMEATPLDAPPAAPAATGFTTPAKKPATAQSVFRTPFASIQQPAYLDEDDESDYFGVGVMTHNAGSSSLEARLAARRKQEEERKNNQGGGKRAAVASMFGRIGTTFGLW